MGAKSQTAPQRSLIEKLSRSAGDPGLAAAVLERHLSSDRTRDELLEDLLQWASKVFWFQRQESSAHRVPVATLCAGFQKAAEKIGVKAEEFYPLFVAKIFPEMQTGETGKESARPSTREKILGAALEVFSEKGFHQATVDEIAERAGLAKGTMYRHFANKEALFNDLAKTRLRDLERRIDAVLDSRDDVFTLIGKYIRTYFEFFDRHQGLYRVIVQEQLEVGDRVQDIYMTKVLRRVPVLKRKIFEANQQGLFKQFDFYTVFYGAMGFIHGVIQRWLAQDCSYPLVSEVETVTEVLFYGFVRRSDKEEDL